MNLKLVIEGDVSQIALVLAALGGPSGGAAMVTNIQHLAPDADEGPANLTAPAVDNRGIPWDERVHAKTKALTEDGKWRKRRGVSDELLAQVEGELLARSGALAAFTPQPGPQAIPMPNMAMPMPQAGQPQPGYVPQPDPMGHPQPMAMQQPQPAPMPQTMPQPGAVIDFAGFMQHLTVQMGKRDTVGNPLIHAEYLGAITREIAGAFNTPVNSITDIATNPNMVTFAVQCLQRDGRWS